MIESVCVCVSERERERERRRRRRRRRRNIDFELRGNKPKIEFDLKKNTIRDSFHHFNSLSKILVSFFTLVLVGRVRRRMIRKHSA